MRLLRFAIRCVALRRFAIRSVALCCVALRSVPIRSVAHEGSHSLQSGRCAL